MERGRSEGPARALPAPSLPKGGGALRGLAETFTVSAPTGTASLAIPIPATPIAGLAPALTLAYDSGQGNGPFGLGFACAVPCIQRRTDRGIPRYHDGHDTFVLSGADDLVRVGDGPVDPDWVVERYQPRREALWARIERLTPRGPGAVRWRITTRDNVVHLYGPDAGSRLADPDDDRRVYRWCLAESRDDKGHVVRYEYKADPGSANLYLKRAFYANELGSDDAFHIQIVFDYGEHGARDATGAGTWAERIDPFSTQRFGFEVRTRRLCQRVLLFHRFPELAGGDWELQRELVLGYQPSPIATLLTSARLVGHRAGEPSVTLPAMTLDWIPIELGQTVATLADAPTGADLRFVDLDAEGIPGVLRERPGTWLYQRNSGGRLARPVEVPEIPSAPGLATGAAELADLAGDGAMRLVRRRPAGFHRRTESGWTDFTPFRGAPTLDLGDPQVRFVDLSGDGLPDALRCEPEVLTWYRSRGEAGWDAPEQAAARIFTDGTGTLFFADMSGDGLADLVRIRDGEVIYWPNRGYGRFGDAVSMHDAPRFGGEDRFDPARLRLGDVDGTGTTDVLYVGDDGAVTWWVNQSGNGFGAPRRIPLPVVDRLDDVQLVDLLGKGTPCLVWSSRAPDGGVRYVDLLPRGKPHLLERVDNGLGLERRLEYAPSTRFAAEDRAAGRPWLTRLPFPVQVLARVITHEQTTGTTLTQTYRYHHGHWDARERELGGFGMVEVEDAERAPQVPPPLAATPALTKTWFHNGALDGEALLARAYAREYTGGDRLADTELPAELTGDARHDAARALRGRMVRTEVFGLDAPALPFVVTEASWVVRQVLPGVHAVRPGETATFHHERAVGDARVRHELVLAADAFDNVTERAEITYPRAVPVEAAQGRLDVVLHRADIVNDVGTRHRLGVMVEQSTQEITGRTPAGALFRPAELAGATGTLLAREKVFFWKDDLSGPLPHRDVGARALAHQTLRLAFADLAIYGGRVTPALAASARYLQDADGFWVPSGVLELDAAQRYLPVRHTDAFGNQAEVRWWHGLVAERLIDARGHEEIAIIDPASLLAVTVEDANGARSGVLLDGIGRVRATWRTGRDGEGDSPAAPGSEVRYELGSLPISTRVRAREQHAVHDPDEPANPRWREIVTYQDGMGREILVKTTAEPDGGAPRWASTGHLIVDNKGQPVVAYEPYFAADDAYRVNVVGKPSFSRYDALGRTTRAERADGALREVVYRSAWEVEHRDENDTLLASRWYADRKNRSDAAGDAARATEAHADTGEITRVDAAGRVVATLRDDGGGTPLVTRVERDVLGRERRVTDARTVLAVEIDRNLLGESVHARTPDGSDVWTLGDAMGRPFRSWDVAGRVVETVHDALSRPIELWVVAGGQRHLRVRTEYGDRTQVDARTHYRIGRAARVWDGAGLVAYEYDFKGSAVRCVRRFVDGVGETDWQSATPAVEEWAKLTRFDAMGRAWSVTAIDGTTTRTVWNEAGFVETVTLTTPAGAAHELVSGCRYDARGQREEVRWSRGAFTTTFGHDDETGRLLTVETTRPSGPKLQDLAFTYDPVGNVTRIADAVLADVYFRNRRVGAEASFVYDPLYRLRRAVGREHAAFAEPYQTAMPGARAMFDPADGQALQTYQEDYDLDEVGNLRSLTHQVLGGARWTRTYRYTGGTSQLHETELSPTQRLSYGHDPSGNLDGMPHVGAMTYDHRHDLIRVELKDGRTVEYAYDGDGRRVRTIVRDGTTILRELLVAGDAEIRREGTLERRTRHVADDKGRFALVERRTRGSDAFPEKTVRFQLGNHIGSAVLELDESGALLTYEEFHPYGTTAYHAEAIEVGRKRWRWAGKERDEETGLVDFGARWYAPWLGRWTAKDPSPSHGVSPYEYCSGNPISRVDPDGRKDLPNALGLRDPEVVHRFMLAVQDIYEHWDSYKSGAERKAAVEGAVNKALASVGVSEAPKYTSDPTIDRTALTDSTHWTMIIGRKGLDYEGGRLSYQQFGDVMGTYLHEAQHFHQYFLRARSYAGADPAARAGLRKPSVPGRVWRAANKDPLPNDPMGAGAQNARELSRTREATETAYLNLAKAQKKLNGATETLAKAEAAYLEAFSNYKVYRFDSWPAGGEIQSHFETLPEGEAAWKAAKDKVEKARGALKAAQGAFDAAAEEYFKVDAEIDSYAVEREFHRQYDDPSRDRELLKPNF